MGDEYYKNHLFFTSCTNVGRQGDGKALYNHVYFTIVWHSRRSLHLLAGFARNPQSILL